MKRFGGDGLPLEWPTPPRHEAQNDKRRKPKPLGDIGSCAIWATTGATIGEEAFIDGALPTERAVFKEPITARARPDFNDGGRCVLEDAATQAGVLGLKFLRPGLAEQAA